MKNIVSIIICALFLLASCNYITSGKDTDTSQAIKLTDTQGNNVVLDSAAQKVVCLFDPSVDIIYMLGAQDKLVGIPAETYFDKELYNYYKLIDSRIANKELATPGSNELTNIESLIALKPDLVIAQQLPPSTIKTLNDMGIAVYLATADTYKNLTKEMTDIATMLGKKERGESLVAYAKNKIACLQNRATDYANEEKQKTVYFTWANGRIFSTAGRNSMMNNCLELAGVENVCPSAIDKPNINPETLIAWNPDMIVMWNDSPDLFYNKKELSSVNAINKKQIFNLMPMFYYNPHTFKSLCAAVAINNWAYCESMDNRKDEIKEIIVELYGKENGEKLIKYL